MEPTQISGAVHLVLTLASLTVSALLALCLTALMWAICRSRIVVNIEIKAIEKPLKTPEMPSETPVIAPVVEATTVIQVPSPPEKKAEVFVGPPKAKPRAYPRCEHCQSEVKSNPINSVINEKSVTNVYRCKSCEKETKVTRTLNA